MGPGNFFGVERSDNLVPPAGEMHRKTATSREAYGLSFGSGRVRTPGAGLGLCTAQESREPKRSRVVQLFAGEWLPCESERTQ